MNLATANQRPFVIFLNLKDCSSFRLNDYTKTDIKQSLINDHIIGDIKSFEYSLTTSVF